MMINWHLRAEIGQANDDKISPESTANPSYLSWRKHNMPSSEAIVLPKSVRPKKYQLKLQPNFSDFTFQGEETVDIEVVEPTAEIVLNAADLQIASAVLRCGGVSSTPANIALDDSRQTATLTFPETILAGEASLEIAFTGELNDKLHGFYRIHICQVFS